MSPSATESVAILMPSRFDRETVPALLQEVRRGIHEGQHRICLDLREVESFDSAGMALVVGALRAAREAGLQIEIQGVQDSVYDFFSLVSVERLLEEPQALPRPGFIEGLGGLALPLAEGSQKGAILIGRSMWGWVLSPFRGQKLRLGKIAEEIFQAGNGAMFIVALIGFLLGLILAMQAWVQLKIFGADIFVADMVAVGVTREIGPLMTGVLVAARSGSSIAARLGTMVINEEVDALEQMGIHPNRYLVAPKVLGLAMATPCLTLVFCTMAILGGWLFGVTTVGLDAMAYIEQTHQALRTADILAAVIKGATFGALIAAVACSLGLGVRGGPEGVGRATTRAVVTSIFLIILVDAFFVLFVKLGA